MRKKLFPILKPSTDYSYLRFIGPPQSDFIEVHLPDDSSYVLDLQELRLFLKQCKISDYEGLVDFIYNFGNVLWNKQNQTYYPVVSKMMLKEEESMIDELAEIPYAFI